LAPNFVYALAATALLRFTQNIVDFVLRVGNIDFPSLPSPDSLLILGMRLLCLYVIFRMLFNTLYNGFLITTALESFWTTHTPNQKTTVRGLPRR
jgi:hypothetical protein